MLKILQKIYFQKQVPWESSPKFVSDIVGFDELKNNFYSPWFHQKTYGFLVGDNQLAAQLTFTCSKSTIETLEKYVKYVQS